LDWPGNARQLANVIESMLVISDHHELNVTDIPEQAYNPISHGKKVYHLADFEKALDEYEVDWIYSVIVCKRNNNGSMQC
jgi:DNA-binding NtrC family response regulator